MPHEQRRDNPGYRVAKKFTDSDGLVHMPGDTYTSLDEARNKALVEGGQIIETREGDDVAHKAKPDNTTPASEQTQGGGPSDPSQKGKEGQEGQDSSRRQSRQDQEQTKQSSGGQDRR
jgi:hypothetical protein